MCLMLMLIKGLQTIKEVVNLKSDLIFMSYSQLMQESMTQVINNKMFNHNNTNSSCRYEKNIKIKLSLTSNINITKY